MVDWDGLRYVLAVQRAGSLNAAARALGVDKATVSRRVAAVEAELHVRLFDRKPDGYALTPHGQRALAAIGHMDDLVAGLVGELSQARGEEGGVVLLTVPQFFASQVLLPALPAFRARHPTIELVVNASSAVLNIARREAEVGLRNVKPRQQSVTVRRAGVLGMAFYGSRVYLARRGKPEGPNDLIKHDLVGWDAAVTHAKALLWANERGHRVVVRVNDAAVMADAVAAGVGLAALPCILGDERDGLVRLDALGLAADDIYAVAPGELRRSARVRAVIDLLSEVWAANRDRLSGKSR